jgi:hypothetical protein
MGLFWPWARAFVFTQVVEMPIYLRGTDGRWGVSFLASTWTHPLVWFVIPELVPDAWGYWGLVAVAEAFAIVAEAAWLYSRGVRRALLWSFLANSASSVAGLLLRACFGAP